MGSYMIKGGHYDCIICGARKDITAGGIGPRLFEAMRRDYEIQSFTVHSSPFAVEVYRRLGFTPTDTERLTDGLRYTPMRFEGEASGRSEL